MANKHFLDCIAGKQIVRAGTWECSRLYLDGGADRFTSAQLISATSRLMIEWVILGLLGIFEHRIIRAYQRLGACLRILGHSDDDGSLIHGGICHLMIRGFTAGRNAQVWIQSNWGSHYQIHLLLTKMQDELGNRRCSKWTLTARGAVEMFSPPLCFSVLVSIWEGADFMQVDRAPIVIIDCSSTSWSTKVK